MICAYKKGKLGGIVRITGGDKGEEEKVYCPLLSLFFPFISFPIPIYDGNTYYTQYESGDDLDKAPRPHASYSRRHDNVASSIHFDLAHDSL